MATKIQFKEREMRAAIDEMRKSSQELQQMSEEFRNLGNWAEQEALKGDAGDSLKQAIQNVLAERVTKLSEKLKQHAAYTEKELQQMIEAAAKLR